LDSGVLDLSFHIRILSAASMHLDIPLVSAKGVERRALVILTEHVLAWADIEKALPSTLACVLPAYSIALFESFCLAYFHIMSASSLFAPPGDTTGVYYLVFGNVEKTLEWTQIKDYARGKGLEIEWVEIHENNLGAWIRVSGRDNYILACGKFVLKSE